MKLRWNVKIYFIAGMIDLLKLTVWLFSLPMSRFPSSCSRAFTSSFRQSFRQSRLNEIAIDLSSSSLPFSPVAAANTEKCDVARCTCSTIYKFDIPTVASISRFFTLIALSHVIRFFARFIASGWFADTSDVKKRTKNITPPSVSAELCEGREQRSYILALWNYLRYEITGWKHVCAGNIRNCRKMQSSCS